jgi:multidrug efflux pump subunit AcrA (membrane-fusion protein)
MMRRQGVVNVVLLAAAAGLVAAGVSSIGSPAQARAVVRTGTVQRGDVQATVTASGNVTAPTTLAVNFTTGGRVTEVDVKAGDQVAAGQVLAKVDDAAQQVAVSSAQANLTAAQQKLSQVENPLSAQQAAVNAAAAQQAAAAVTSAQTSLADQQRMARANATGYQNAVNSAQAQLQTDQNQEQTDEQQLQADQAANPSAVPADQQKVASDKQAVTKDQNTLASAQTAQAQGLAKDQQTVDNAQQAVVSAQNAQASTLANNALKAAPPLPGDLATAQAAVTAAQAALTNAQQALAGTVLTAPSNGTITALNGIVGQTVSGGGTSAGSSSASGAGSGSGSSTGSSSFLTLIDLSNMAVKAGFSETDAARVAVGQPATVTFPAVPSLQVAAHVLSVDAISTVVSNVVTYPVTLSIDNAAPQIKPGMSANVTVVVAMANGVLHVPSTAVRGTGSTATVTVMNGGKASTVSVIVGVRGDQDFEIASGLNQGDQVVVSTGTVTGSSTGTANRTGGGLGGFGGAFAGIGGGRGG